VLSRFKKNFLVQVLTTVEHLHSQNFWLCVSCFSCVLVTEGKFGGSSCSHPLKKLNHNVKKLKKTEKAPHFSDTIFCIRATECGCTKMCTKIWNYNYLMRSSNPSFLWIADLDLSLFDNQMAKNVQVNAFLVPARASVFYKGLLGSGKILQPPT
jgi:hypothetical protein